MIPKALRVFTMICLSVLLGGCLVAHQPAEDPWASLRQADGTVTWMEELNFIPPPEPWRLLDLSETDFSLAFFNSCTSDDPGHFPCEATIAYAGEPFGYSQELRLRQKEFFKRFLWAARLIFEEPKLEEASLDGRKALIATTTGQELVRGHRVQTKVIFVQRGERVEAFFMNQWRSKDKSFDPAEFEVFDRFVSTFKYKKPSFYESL